MWRPGLQATTWTRFRRAVIVGMVVSDADGWWSLDIGGDGWRMRIDEDHGRDLSWVHRFPN